MSCWAMFGLAAGIVSIADPLPYIRDVLRGVTRPYRGTWLIWLLLGSTAFASQWADGADWSLIMVGAQTTGIVVIFVLSIRRGEGGLSRLDGLLIGVAGLGVLGWAVCGVPLVATAFIVAADLVAALMMLPKTWRDPSSETLSTYVMATAAGGLGAAAVEDLDVNLLLYPVYFALINAMTALVIALRRRAVANRPAKPSAGTDGAAYTWTAIRLGPKQPEIR